ncbi:MAG: hypothetical protein ACYDGY_05045 [Acidimicrobiales bacterium]
MYSHTDASSNVDNGESGGMSTAYKGARVMLPFGSAVEREERSLWYG